MLGIFGGSFDPPHFGHIKSALSLIKFFEFEQILFVPCRLSPHKKNVHASDQHRLQMLNIICANQDKFIVDDRELKRQPPSYTIDTLIELREEFGRDQSLVMLLGVDTYLSFCQWHRYEEILDYSHVMIMQRPGYTLPESGCEKEYLSFYSAEEIDILVNSSSGKIYISDLEKIEISSSVVRKTIFDGEQPRYLIPGNVWSYIQRNKLYQKQNEL